MKLKRNFVTHMVGDRQIMVPVGGAAEGFNGFVRSNETAAFIVDCFKKDTTPEAVTDALLAEFDTDRSNAERAVQYVMDRLNELKAFE